MKPVYQSTGSHGTIFGGEFVFDYETGSSAIVFMLRFVSRVFKNDGIIFTKIRQNLKNWTGLSWNQFIYVNFYSRICILRPTEQLYDNFHKNICIFLQKSVVRHFWKYFGDAPLNFFWMLCFWFLIWSFWSKICNESRLWMTIVLNVEMLS